MQKEAKENKAGEISFIKEVTKYFMDFLETDFHKRKFPRRSVKFRNTDNLLIGLNLQKYPSFNKRVLKLVAKGFNNGEPQRIEKGIYKTNLPKNLLDLIKLQIGKIKNAEINDLTGEIAEAIEKAGTLHAQEYDVALTTSIEEAGKYIREQLVRPFIENIEKPLQNLNLGDEDNVYLIEEELTGVILRSLENKISEVLNLLIAKEKVNLEKELRTVFIPQDVKANITAFFENLQVADLFLEMFEMERNRTILDKQDFYLYFGDISFNNAKYPIFYISFSIQKEDGAFSIDFDAQVYINKKALEYVVQEYNKQKGTKGNLQTVTERIIYLSQHKEDFDEIINSILAEITNFFNLDKQVSFSSEEIELARSAAVRVSSSCYVCLFDKSDEALVNDYEEILQQLSQDGGVLAEMFHKLIEDFVHKNPESFNPEVEEEWDNTATTDKLVYTSPIPLNSEQRQILAAVRRDNCKYITVEGPPGTGKSHTITAIIFDAILKNQSVLMLSDKKEALDVVEDKITQTMNKVRYDKNFQNPILRLGKIGNTYNSILAKSSIENIKTHFRAVKNAHENENIGETITKLQNTLKEDVEAELLAYSKIRLPEIHEYFDLELYFRDRDAAFDFEELAAGVDSATELDDVRATLLQISEVFKLERLTELLALVGVVPNKIKSFKDFQKLIKFLSLAFEHIEKVKTTFVDKTTSLQDFTHFNTNDLPTLHSFIQKFTQVKYPVVGYLFTKSAADKINNEFKQTFVYANITTPHEQLLALQNVYDIQTFIKQLGRETHKDTELDYVALMHELLTSEQSGNALREVVALEEDFEYLTEFSNTYPKTATKIGFNQDRLESLFSNKLLSTSDLELGKQIKYLDLKQRLNREFNNIPELNYASRMKQIEDLVTTQVTYQLDGSLIHFYEHNKADAETLRSIIRNKQRFPKDDFYKLKGAFPCILAGIRDYAEYIPLEAAMFDLVVIDEASQVSIAQAFPALIRAKKVLILGDKKQFSNVKAAQARSDTNKEYLNNIEATFRDSVSTEATKLMRLTKFNIKTSILEFFGFISNYSIQLLKHFRGYKEIISYSNKYFYQESLQVMKIRGKQIGDVIKFSFVEAKESDELYPNTNAKEAEFIIDELKKLKGADRNLSVGIITPHTNQQKLLVEMISKLPEWDYFLDKLELKIMTFDTCQGEERDVIYYSMVASSHSDKLWGVFIKDLSQVDIEEDGQIKAQRLNVGLSRAKECVHFVLSKPTTDFTGSIGEALRHYQYVLDEARNERSTNEVDKKSQKESEVLHWFYQTKFWKDHQDAVEFIPQFEIGKYLKQLDRAYSHPEYKVDFLLIYTDEQHREHKIIIEYDGFLEHFKNIDEVNEFNYENYYTDEDVYRQKVLESYGYKFLRINKFNASDNPVAKLDERISRLLKNRENVNSLLTNIHNTVEGLHNGDMKECPRCNVVRSLKDFKDSSLISGYGRFCRECKAMPISYSTPTSSTSRITQRKEDTIEKVKIAIKDNLVIKMKYKGMKREIHPYSADNTYCTAYCTYRKDLRTFRIDRMQDVDLGEQFSFENSLKNRAESKVIRSYPYR